MLTNRPYPVSFHRIALVAIISMCCGHLSYGQHWQWAFPVLSQGPELYVDYARNIAVDANGNSYIAGRTSGDVLVDNVWLRTNGGNSDFFIAKFDPSGNVLWADLLGGANGYEGSSVDVDKDANCYFTGFLVKSGFVGGIHVTVKGAENLVVVKCDTDGRVLWANAIEGKCCKPRGIVKVDGFGNVFVIGTYRGEIQVSGVSLVSNTYKMFIAKYDRHGTFLWIKNYGASGEHVVETVAMDKEGNAYISGYYTGSISYGETEFSSQPAVKNNYFLTKLSPEGTVRWAKHVYSFPYDNIRNSTLDAAGNVYLVGSFNGTVTFDHIPISSTPEQDGRPSGDTYVAKYDTNGTIQWVRSFGSSALNESGNAIAVDNAGNCFITGKFWEEATFGQWRLCGKDMEAFVLKVDAHGNVVWAISAGDTNYEDPRDIVLDPEGNLLITGFYNKISRFGATTFGTEHDDKVRFFVAKLDVSSFVPSTLVTHAVTPAIFCPGMTLEVSFDITGNVMDCNIFEVQLSDANGSFASPVTIGSGFASPLNARIPANAAAGEAYRIRILSTAPSLTGSDNGSDLIIDPIPQAPSGVSSARCDAGVFELTASTSGTEAIYRWYSNAVGDNLIYESTTSSFTTPFLTSSTPYFVSQVNRAGCESQRTGVLAIVPALAVQALVKPGFCIEGGSIQVVVDVPVSFTNNSVGATGFLWEFGDGTSTTEEAPAHQYKVAGEYVVLLTAFSANGCQEVLQVAEVSVKDKKPIPNVITPNGDDKNQYFVVEATCEPLHLQVFNRWGILVFEEQQYRNTWDGENLPAGVYYYRLKADRSPTVHGWLQLLR